MKNLEMLLLNDCFDHADANDLLVGTIDKKINYYKLKNLQHQIRYEMPDYSAQQKLVELQSAREELLRLIAQAKQHKSELKIEATVSVEPDPSESNLATGTFG